MHPNVDLIQRFYVAFRHRDWSTMNAFYHSQVHFTDPVFDLHGAHASMMWRMLCTNARDLTLEFSDVAADDLDGQAHWEARYTFSATGAKVHNIIDSSFEFRDSLIVRHIDRFSFWRWSRQALGATGWLLGWSGSVRRKVQHQAAKNLALFERQVARL
jgi:SnoaL-like domain